MNKYLTPPPTRKKKKKQRKIKEKKGLCCFLPSSPQLFGDRTCLSLHSHREPSTEPGAAQATEHACALK